MPHTLDNIFWNSLSGPHRNFAVGTPSALRYAPGFSPIVAFPDAEAPDFAALEPFCPQGESFYVDGWSGPVPDGWKIDMESTMYRMYWKGTLQDPWPGEDEAPDAVPLGPEHAAHALELALLTRPGPFGLRTIELGDYFGYFEGDRLVAMAGERMCAGDYHEISGVCTHPDFQGRGYAKRLMGKLLRRHMLREKISFLHVVRTNTTAHTLYQRMGFGTHCESVVRVVSRR